MARLYTKIFCSIMFLSSVFVSFGMEGDQPGDQSNEAKISPETLQRFYQASLFARYQKLCSQNPEYRDPSSYSLPNINKYHSVMFTPGAVNPSYSGDNDDATTQITQEKEYEEPPQHQTQENYSSSHTPNYDQHELHRDITQERNTRYQRLESESRFRRNYYAQQLKENAFEHEIAVRWAYNHADKEYLQTMEEEFMNSPYKQVYLRAKEYADAHPELRDRNNWPRHIRYNPQHEQKKIETTVFSTTLQQDITRSTEITDEKEPSNELETNGIQNPTENTQVNNDIDTNIQESLNETPDNAINNTSEIEEKKLAQNKTEKTRRSGSHSQTEQRLSHYDQREHQEDADLRQFRKKPRNPYTLSHFPEVADEEENAYFTSRYQLIQRMHEQYQKIQITFHKNNLHSQYHKDAFNSTWNEIIERINHQIEQAAFKQYCGHLQDRSQQLECINNIKIDYLNSNFDAINLNDIRYTEALEEFYKKCTKIYEDYRNWEKYEYLPQLRKQPDNDRLRRLLEVRHATDEDRNQLIAITKELQEKYDAAYQQLPWGVSLWENTVGLFSKEKSSKQKLREEYRKEREDRLNNAIDAISNRYKALDEERQNLEKQTQALEKEKEKSFEQQKILYNVLKQLENINKKRSTTLEDTEIILENDAPTTQELLDGFNSNDLIVTTRSNTFLKQVGIDPEEFRNFTGNKEQNDFHQQLNDCINNASHFVLTDDSELATKIREIVQDVFKAAYALNKGNYTDLARELLSFVKHYANFSLFPIRTTGNELKTILQNPLSYGHERIKNIIQCAGVVAESCYDITQFIVSDTPFLEKYEIIEKAVSSFAQTSAELIKKDRELSLKDREEMLAKFAIDFGFDYVTGMAISKIIKNIKIYKQLNYNAKKSNIIDVEWKPITPKAPTLEITTESQLPALVSDAEKGIQITEHSTEIVEKISEPIVVHPEATASEISTAAGAEVIGEKGLHDLTNINKTENKINITLLRKEFNQTVQNLKKQYNPSFVQEATDILKLNNDRTLSKIKNPDKLLEQTIIDLIKIDSNERWKTFRYDPAKNFKCDYNTIEEAIAGIACEEQGLLEGLIRDPKKEGGGEFIDKFGRIWDVKTAKSEALTGKNIFETNRQVNEFFESVQDELAKKTQEHVIINITHLNETDHLKIHNGLKKLSKEKIERIIIIDAKNSKNSKSTNNLLKLLEK